MNQRSLRTLAKRAVVFAGVITLSAACATTGVSTSEPSSQAPNPQSDFTPRTVTVIGTGDILIHNTLWFQAQADATNRAVGGMDFYPQLAGIKSLIAPATLAVCNQETNIAPLGGPYKSASSTTAPWFNTPPQIVKAEKKVGYDTCSITSVHALDHGYAGVVRTVDAMEKNKINWSGANRTAAEADTPRIVERGGVNFAQLSYSDGFNGNPEPTDKPWAYQDVNLSRILDDARRSRDAGAEVVVVSVHAGDEYSRQASTGQKDLFKAIAKSGLVNIIYGVGSHVVAPVKKLKDTWVTYGLGNLLSGQDDVGHRREGAAVEFTLTEQTPGEFGVTAGTGYPIYNQPNPSRLINLVKKLPPVGGPARWQEAYSEVKTTLLADGAGKDGFDVPQPRG